MTAVLTLALLLALVGYCFIKPRPTRFLDGGATLVAIIMILTLAGLVADKQLNDGRVVKKVGQTIDKPMCRVTQAC